MESIGLSSWAPFSHLPPAASNPDPHLIWRRVGGLTSDCLRDRPHCPSPVHPGVLRGSEMTLPVISGGLKSLCLFPHHAALSWLAWVPPSFSPGESCSISSHLYEIGRNLPALRRYRGAWKAGRGALRVHPLSERKMGQLPSLSKMVNVAQENLPGFPGLTLGPFHLTVQQSPSVNPNKSECQHLLKSVMCRQFLENKYLCMP